GGIDLAGGRAAVAVERVAIVALLGPVDVSVTADRHVTPADDGLELVGLNAAGGKTGTLDLEDVRAAGTTGHALKRIRVPDQPGRGRRRARREAQEGSHVAVEGGGEIERGPTDGPGGVEHSSRSTG